MTTRGKALVTGAAGFIGSHLTEKLVQEGFEVRTLIRSSSNSSFLKSLDVEIVQGDIRDPVALQKVMAGCRHVYHLAAKTTLARSSRKEYYDINLKGTQNICRAALKENVERFIYGSTVGVYGLIKNQEVDENTKPNPDSHYRRSKLLAEGSVLDSHQKHGLPAVIVRLSTVLGPRSTNLLKLFQDISARKFRMIGSGENHNHFGYVSDIVDGLTLCATAKDVEGCCYILAGPEALPIKDFVDLISRECGGPFSYARLPIFLFYPFQSMARFTYNVFGRELPFSHRLDFFLSDRTFNIAKAQKELGYSPSVTVKEGISRAVKWYRENQYL